jgi:homoserine kinase
MGRGLGFSGAARVAGLVAGLARAEGSRFDLAAAAPEVLARATALEGHADNVAASLYGGVVAAAGGRVVRVPLAFDPAVVVWIPSFTTSTDASRGRLSPTVERGDAVFNVGRTALLVAALAAGDVGALRTATEDRLHQDARLARAEPSRRAIAAAIEAGAWGAWLSGSGPTVATFCAPDRAEAVARALPADGHTKVLRIDHAGAVVEDA